jgi:hypothetical protein
MGAYGRASATHRKRRWGTQREEAAGEPFGRSLHRRRQPIQRDVVGRWAVVRWCNLRNGLLAAVESGLESRAVLLLPWPGKTVGWAIETATGDGASDASD